MNNSVAFVDVVKFSIDLAFKMGPVIAKFTDKDVKPPFNNDKTSEILEGLKQNSKKIYATQAQSAEYVALAINSVSHMVTNNLALSVKMFDIVKTINHISSRFDQMQNFEAHKDKLEIDTLITFAKWTVESNTFSVHHLMDLLHRTLLGTEDATLSSGNHLLSELADRYKETEEMCRTMQSEQQFVYSLYTHITLAELKG